MTEPITMAAMSNVELQLLLSLTFTFRADLIDELIPGACSKRRKNSLNESLTFHLLYLIQKNDLRKCC